MVAITEAIAIITVAITEAIAIITVAMAEAIDLPKFFGPRLT